MNAWRSCRRLACLALLPCVAGCSDLAKHLAPPRGVIVASHAGDGFEGLDYTGNVTCDVRNVGGHGDVRVAAHMVAGRDIRHEQVVPMAAGEERRVLFVFPEIEWTDAFSRVRYRCDVD